MERMTKGTRVRHESKTHWGVGQLLEGESSNGFRIYFENVGLKEISSDYRNLIHLVRGVLAQLFQLGADHDDGDDGDTSHHRDKLHREMNIMDTQVS